MARKAKDAAADMALTFRLPRELHQRLVEAADGRSISEEMRRRLEASFAGEVARPATDDPWFNDLLTAIAHAAAGAAKMKQRPMLPPGVLDRDGKQRPYDVERWGPDTTAYETFAEAVHTLLAAFAPEGIVAVSREAQLRLADQLIGLALGALGDRGLAAFANLSEVDQEGMRLSGGAASALTRAAQPSDEGDKP
jgi:hypothetical protein